MNKRLQQFILAENLSQSQFADKINVARASVSHILAGRNKPGFDFVEKMAKAFPALNIEWLITGKGKIYKTATAETVQPSNKSDDYAFDLFSDSYTEYLKPEPVQPAIAAEENVDPSSHGGITITGSEARSISSTTKERHSQTINKQRSISRIVVFYDDNTFQELK